MNQTIHKKEMKGVICYYSNTENTFHVSNYLASFLCDYPIELCNMATSPPVNPLHYDFFGFASPVEFFGLPSKAWDWIGKIPPVTTPRHAFILLTHSSIPGTAMVQFKERVQSRNFNIIAGHALKCPESYPPLRVKGFTSSHTPGPRSLYRFRIFAAILKDLLHSASEDRVILEARLRLNFINYFFSPPGKNIAHYVMGFKYLDLQRCTRCTVCSRDCPYSAILIQDYPQFDESLCKGCWKCYNRCPSKAIYTRFLKGKGHYRGAKDSFKKKIQKALSLS